MCQQEEEASDFLFLLGKDAAAPTDVVLVASSVAPPANGIEYHFVFRPLGLDKSSARLSLLASESAPSFCPKYGCREMCFHLSGQIRIEKLFPEPD